MFVANAKKYLPRNKRNLIISRNESTYLAVLDCDPPAVQVLPTIVIATPAMLTSTEITLTTVMDSSPRSAPIKRVKRPDVEDNNVVLATLVLASAAFVRYCSLHKNHQQTISVKLKFPLTFRFCFLTSVRNHRGAMHRPTSVVSRPVSFLSAFRISALLLLWETNEFPSSFEKRSIEQSLLAEGPWNSISKWSGVLFCLTGESMPAADGLSEVASFLPLLPFWFLINFSSQSLMNAIGR